MNHEKPRWIRSAIGILLGLTVGVAAWIAGILTVFATITGCTWAERNAPVVYLLFASLLAAAFYLLHRLPSLNGENAASRTRVFACLLVGPWLFGVLISGPDELGAVNRSRQKRTMADMRQFGNALQRYRDARGEFPVTQKPDELYALLLEFSTVSERDAWGNPWVVRVSSSGYTLVSLGKCGESDFPTLSQYEFGGTSGYQSDIVYSNGEFVRWPEGVQAN